MLLPINRRAGCLASNLRHHQKFGGNENRPPVNAHAMVINAYANIPVQENVATNQHIA